MWSGTASRALAGVLMVALLLAGWPGRGRAETAEAPEAVEAPVYYPTFEACYEAYQGPCAEGEEGWGPAEYAPPDSYGPGIEPEEVDTEWLARQLTTMEIGTRGTPEHPVVAVDMVQVHFPDAQPYLDHEVGRVRVPIRFVSEQMGAKVTWDDATQTVTITREGLVVQLRVDDPTATVNGRTITIDAPPKLIPPGRVMVPLRFISEAFGAKVDWIGEEPPSPDRQHWGKYQVWIWVPWGYWGLYTIHDRLEVKQVWFYYPAFDKEE